MAANERTQARSNAYFPWAARPNQEAHMGRAWITDRRPPKRTRRHPQPEQRLELPLDLPTEREALPPESRTEEVGERGVADVDFYI